jgi:hypothetical protein
VSLVTNSKTACQEGDAGTGTHPRKQTNADRASPR